MEVLGGNCPTWETGSMGYNYVDMCSLHRAGNVGPAQKCSDWCYSKCSTAMLGSPRLAEAVSSAELFPIPTRSSFTADSTPKKPRLTGYVFRCKRGKWRKAKEKEVKFSRKLRLIMTCHHDVSAPLRHLRACFFSSSRNQPVFRSVVMCVVPSSKDFLFLWLAKLFIISRMGSKTWRQMTSLRSIAKSGACSVFSALGLVIVISARNNETVTRV